MNMRNERNNNVSNRSYYGPEQRPTGGGGPRPPVSKYDRNNDRNNDRNRQQPQPPNKYKYERKQDPRFNQQVEKVEEKTFVPTTPDSSPPPPANNHRKTIDVDEPSITPLVVNFGEPVITAIKKRVAVATKKPVLVPVDDSTTSTTTAAAVSTTTEI